MSSTREAQPWTKDTSSWIRDLRDSILPIWDNPSDQHQADPDPRSRYNLDLAKLESYHFRKLVVAVAGLGFFADGYLLFAGNFALPVVGHLYWTKDTQADHETTINTLNLTGCLLGQVVLGILADRYGRRKLYGWELVILMLGSTNVALAAQGLGSMNIKALLVFWRWFSGIGIGAEYPTTAVITSEWAPTLHRARMLATVFAMQSLGQLCAAVVAFLVIRYSVNEDSMWRWIFGVGAIPAALVLVLRRMIPESPRYTFDIQQNPKKANEDINGGRRKTQDTDHDSRENIIRNGFPDPTQSYNQLVQQLYFPPLPSWSDFCGYLFDQGNWQHLVATAGSWFLLDLSFYGLGLNSPQIVSELYDAPAQTHLYTYNGTGYMQSNATNGTARKAPSWSSEPNNQPLTIFEDNALHSIIIVSIPAVLGSLMLIWLVNHTSRKKLQIGGFLLLATLFLVIGVIITAINPNRTSNTIIVIIYATCQFLFNLGPNGLTFMFPAEIFPTRYRCTCHGISAAAGKLGSIIAQATLRDVQINQPGGKLPEPRALGHVLIGFGCAMAVGAALSLLLPEVQDAGYKSKTLEDLAKGYSGRNSQSTFPMEAVTHPRSPDTKFNVEEL